MESLTSAMASPQYQPPSAPPKYSMEYNQSPSQPPPQMGYSMASYPPPQPILQQPPPQVSVTSVNVGTSGPASFVPGSCPVCHGMSWTGSYPCCAWLVCLIFFPVGIVCCLCMRKKKCTKCGFTLG